MMLTAKHFDEVAIYRAASAFEKAGDWKGIRLLVRSRLGRGAVRGRLRHPFT